MTYWQGYYLTKERNVECLIYNILFSSVLSTMDIRIQTNTYFNTTVTKIISFITHYSSIRMSNLSGHFSTIIFYIILELTLMKKENRRKKEVYEGPSDFIYKTTDVRENQEPPLGVTASLT